MTWENIVQPGRSQMRTRSMRNAYWIPMATDTQSEYVVLIVFWLQQWLHERVPMLRYTNITCLNFNLWHDNRWHRKSGNTGKSECLSFIQLSQFHIVIDLTVPNSSLPQEASNRLTTKESFCSLILVKADGSLQSSQHPATTSTFRHHANRIRRNSRLFAIFRNYFSAFGKSLCTFKICCKWCPRASI
jgi:hypothetical protein